MTVAVLPRGGKAINASQVVTVHGPATELDVTLNDGEGNMHHKSVNGSRDELNFTVTAYDNHANHGGERVQLPVPAGLALDKASNDKLDMTVGKTSKDGMSVQKRSR